MGLPDTAYFLHRCKGTFNSPCASLNNVIIIIIIIIIITTTTTIIIIIIIVSFMQGIHTHIPQTNHVPRGYTVAAILSLLFMVPLSLVLALGLLFFYFNTFRSMYAVPNMAVFCSSLTSCFPGMSLTYFLNDLEMVPIIIVIIIIIIMLLSSSSSSSSTFPNSQHFRRFSQQYLSHKAPYSLCCTACINYYCLLHCNIWGSAVIERFQTFV